MKMDTLWCIMDIRMWAVVGKLIFCDVDGTIAGPGEPPRPSTVEAIRAARSGGHKVFLSTGRLEMDVAENVRAIGFDGGIYSAGGRAVVDGKEVLNRPIPKDLAGRIMDALRREDVFFMVESSAGTYGSVDGEIQDHGSDLMYTIRETHPFQSEEQRALAAERLRANREFPVYKILVLLESAAQAQRLRQELGPAVKIVLFDKVSPDMPWIPGEISDASVNKGTAFRFVCDYLNAAPEDTIAFGDSMNDAEILRTAGTGIAMGNAEAEVKEIASQVCERWDDDGIAKALVRMGLIEAP